MYDLLDKIYTDIIIQLARNENEHKAFCDMVDRYNGEEYIFLFRCKDINSSGILSGSKHKIPDTEEFDTTLSLILTRKWTKEVLNHPEIYRRFRNKDSFGFLDLDGHAYYDMTLCVLRFPISETVYECVITNLAADDFSAEEIKKLYAMRWGSKPCLEN